MCFLQYFFQKKYVDNDSLLLISFEISFKLHPSLVFTYFNMFSEYKCFLDNPCILLELYL
jgi:hypothetical protein